jgi:integrase
MATIKLTQKTVDALPAPTDSAQAYYWDEELAGFGVVVGRTGSKTFVARRWVNGGKVKVTIGVLGKVRDDGHEWTLALARQRARQRIGEMASGVNPNQQRSTARGGITLREALELHVNEMRDNGRRPISITTVEYDVTRLLERELDRPLAELTVEAVQKIKERGRKYRTQTNRLLAHLSAVFNTARKLRRSTFIAENPVGRFGVSKYSLKGEHAPEQPRVLEEDMPEWLRRVEALTNPIRRDLQLVAMFTGMRDSNVTGLRWEMIDWSRGGLVVPMSKTTPFTIPVSSTVIEILRRRRDENAYAFRERGGDHGWVFPCLDNDENVVAVTETKERRHDTFASAWGKHQPKSAAAPTGKRVLYLPGLHALRRTFLSVAHEVGVAKLDQMILSNHAIGGRDVHDGYVRAAFAHLAGEAARIDEALWARLRPA